MELCAVGYSFRNYSMEFALIRAERYGYKAVEMRDFSGYDWSVGSVDSCLGRAADEVRAHSLIPLTLFQYPRIGSDHRFDITAWQRLFKAMARESMPFLHLHVYVEGVPSSAVALPEHYELAGAALASLAEEAGEQGVELAVETHMGTLHDSVEGMNRLIEACSQDDVKVSLDFANMMIVDQTVDLADIITMYSEKIGYVHIKNLGQNDDWSVPVRMGKIDYRRLLPVLRKHYAGYLGVEYCGYGDPDWVVADDASYLRSLLVEL